MSTAPDCWTSTTVGEVTLPVDKHRPEDKPTQEFRYVDISSIDNGSNRVVEPKLVLGRDAPSRARQVVRAGDTVLSTVRTYLRNTAIVPADLDGATASTGFSVLRPDPDRVDPRFLFYRVLEQGFVESLSEKQTGTSYPAVRDRDVRAMAFSHPTLPEQYRIVDAIEEQFSRLDAGVESLHRAKRNLARLRAAVLKAAVEGRLVPQSPTDGSASELLAKLSECRRQAWIQDHPGRRYKEPRSPDVREPGINLPSGWAMVSVDQVSSRIEYGTSAKASPDLPGGLPVLRMGNIVDGSLSLDDLKYLPKDHRDVERLSLVAGDLLFNRTNSTELVGKSAVFGESDPPALFASYLIRVRFLSGIDPRYVAHVINSPYGRAHIARVRSQQVGQANVNGSKLAAFPVPLPPTTEQVRIVAEIERQLSIMDALEGALDSACIRAAGLRRSTLRDAFAGRLVSTLSLLEVADA